MSRGLFIGTQAVATPVKEVKLALPAPIMCKVPQLRVGLMRPLLLHNERVDGPALCGYYAGNQGCHLTSWSPVPCHIHRILFPLKFLAFIFYVSTSELLEEVI